MAKKTRQPLHYSLTLKAPNRRSLDVGQWRTALRAADMGRVKNLYDLFDDLLADGTLADAMQKRIDAVCNSALTFINAEGEEVEEVAKLIDTLGFENVLTEIMKCRFYGRSGFELEFPTDGELLAHAIPAKHIHLASRTILREDSDESGIPYDGDDFLCVLGKERDFGLFLKTAPYIIYKRGGFGDWAQWIELFGMPQRIGKYNTYDPESRRLLEQAFEQAGSAPWVVIPKEAEVETKETSGGNGTSYNDFRKACNEEVLITILGQTMTTVQGDKGARSLGEVHKEVEEGKNVADLRFVERVLNSKVLPMLAARGIPVQGGRFTFPKGAEALSVTDIVQLSDIMEIPTSYLHDKYAIPIPQDGEPIARRAATPSFGFDGAMPLPDEEGNSTEKNITHADRSWWTRLRDFFAIAPQPIGAIQMATNGSAHTLPEGATMEERLIAGVANGEITTWNAELFNFISQDLLKAVQTAFKRHINNADTEFEYGAQDDAFITAMEMNLYRFSAGKTLAEIQALNDAFRASSSYDDFKQKAEKITDTFNHQWQRTEYNTAVLCAEQASTYHRLKAQTKLYPYWEYRTTGDDRVREEHADLDGVVLSASHPKWKEIYPPNGWGCRCYVVPKMEYEVTQDMKKDSAKRVKEYQKTRDWKMAVEQGWGVNRSETAQVFIANQQYVRKFPTNAKKRIDDLHYQDYGLESFSTRLKNATEELPQTYEGHPLIWYDNHPFLTDYKGRIVTIDKDVFKDHTLKKGKEERIPLLAYVGETLQTPDEVWLVWDKKTREELHFVKFYKGLAMLVSCEVIEGREYRIKTWFEINQSPNIEKTTKGTRNSDPRWKYRSGLLIKK